MNASEFEIRIQDLERDACAAMRTATSVELRVWSKVLKRLRSPLAYIPDAILENRRREHLDKSHPSRLPTATMHPCYTGD